MHHCSGPGLRSFRSEVLAPRHSCHGLSWAYDWPGFQWDSTVAPVAGQLGAGPSTSVPPETQSSYQDKLLPRPQPSSQPGKRWLGELGLPSNLRVSEKFAALVDDASKAQEVPSTVENNLRRKDSGINAQHTAGESHPIGKGKLSKLCFYPSPQQKAHSPSRQMQAAQSSLGVRMILNPLLCTYHPQGALPHRTAVSLLCTC